MKFAKSILQTISIFPFSKFQISIKQIISIFPLYKFQNFILFCFVSFHFANYSKPTQEALKGISLIVKPILLVSTNGNISRKVLRICILILGVRVKGFHYPIYVFKRILALDPYFFSKTIITCDFNHFCWQKTVL